MLWLVFGLDLLSKIDLTWLDVSLSIKMLLCFSLMVFPVYLVVILILSSMLAALSSSLK